VLRNCCNGEARVLLNDHFQARIDRKRELYEAVEAKNLQLETQTRAAWQRAYNAYTAELAAREQAQAQAQARRHRQQRRPQPLERGFMAPYHRRRHPAQRAESLQRPCPRFSPRFTMSRRRNHLPTIPPF
jgi:hypothetical protein